MHVFVTRKLPGNALDLLRANVDVDLWEGDGPVPRAVLRGCAADVDGLLCMLTDRIDAELLGDCEKLRVVSSMSVGVDHVDLEACTRRGILVGNTPGVLAETTADLTFGMILAAARRIGEADRFVRSGEWAAGTAWDPDMLVGRDVFGATLGIVGLGAVGQAVARRAAGFSMRVLGWSRSDKHVPGVTQVDLNGLYAESDFVAVTVAQTDETRGLVGANAFAAMKHGVVIVNTARGGIVDEVALLAGLESGAVAAAGLDVFDTEPLPPTARLLQLPNVVVSPHIGSATAQTRERMAVRAAENLVAGLRGESMPSRAN